MHLGTNAELDTVSELGNRKPERCCVFQRSAQKQRVLHAGATVGYETDANLGQFAQRSEMGTGSVDGDTPSYFDMTQRCFGQRSNVLNDRGSVDGRHRVRHRQHGCETA